MRRLQRSLMRRGSRLRLRIMLMKGVIRQSSRVSETQNHQIAALKEKQIETLKAALGIESEGDREKKHHEAMASIIEENEDEDEPINVHKKNIADIRKHGVKNVRDEKDDTWKVIKTNTSSRDEPKFHSKDKIRVVHNDSSNSDSDQKRERKYSYNLLLQYLHKSQSITMLGIINEHINFQVSPGQPSSIADDAEFVALYGSSQDAADLINQK